MKYEQLVILLPCHSLEDFPLHHDGDDAEGLLANWTAMWHPALIASVEGMPSWCRVDDPPEQLAGKLLLAPSVSLHEMPTGFAQRAKGDGANLIRKKIDRDEIVRDALEQLDGGDAGVDPQLAADFLALGYCYLQVELLTRQMRYSSNLDEVYFTQQVTAAANAAVAGNVDEAKTKLQACFDVLAEERSHYYPVDAFILDLTLVAPTTIGASLRQELAAGSPLNLLISGETAALLAEKEPETLAALEQALAEQRVCLVGGETVERRLPLLSHEGLLEGLRVGLAEYEQKLKTKPHVFGRRRYGLTPALPQILHGLGFTGAIHATLDDGRFPEGTQIKTRWEGSDGTPIDAIARAPQDATKAQTFLGYAVKLGESMDSDHVATICLAHWPGQTSRWFEDLRRAASYSPALGKLITLDAYFAETDSAPHTDRFEADQYRDPYLKQAVIRKHEDPISTTVRYWKRRAAADAAQSLSALAGLASGDANESAAALLAEIERTADDADNTDNLDARIDTALDAAAQRFADCIPRGDGPQQSGVLAANPLSFVRRVGLEVEGLSGLPAPEKPIVIADQHEGRTQVVVDVPPMGFAWLAAGDAVAAPARDSKKQLAETDADYCLLRNEFFEVIINTASGALQSIHEYKRRGNRLSQQLALRTQGERPRPGEAYSGEDGGIYSEMAADSVKVTAATAAMGEIVARGKLLDAKGKPVAGFKQTYRLWRGSRVLELEVELDPQAELKSDPWNNYYCLRFAWPSEAGEIHRGVHEARHASHAKRIVAPHYLEIDDPKHRTQILTGGLPYHRLVGMRMLDSLLVVRGERERRFRVGMALDLTHPMQDAISLLAPIPRVPQTAAVPTVGTSSWLFHIDSRNVVATHWSPIVEEGRVTGFRTRLLETSGRTSKVGLSVFRPVKSARRVDFTGQEVMPLEVADGKVQLELAQRQWVEIEARF